MNNVLQYSLLNGYLRIAIYFILLITAGMMLYYCREVLVFFREKQLPAIFRRVVIRSCFLPLVCGAVCFLLCYDNMFRRFSYIDVNAAEMHLRYFWPKSKKVIHLNEVSEIRLDEDRKHHGKLIVFSGNDKFYSISCLKHDGLDKIQIQLQKFLDEHRQTNGF